jgi:DNA-binding NarL/FixJ family response regulator
MKLFHDLLEAYGYHPIGTRNGIEALDLARKHRPDLILMDIMHRLNGAIDAAFEVHRVHPCRDALGTFLYDRVSENRRSGGAITESRDDAEAEAAAST